jgi:hypothetical protein
LPPSPAAQLAASGAKRTSAPAPPQVLKRVAELGELVSVALNTHGTRAVQKLIETLSSREQRQIVIDSLGQGVVALIKDLNGNHVVQRCLQRLGPEDSQFIYDAGGRPAGSGVCGGGRKAGEC